jgi:hypothetical protein
VRSYFVGDGAVLQFSLDVVCWVKEIDRDLDYGVRLPACVLI